MTGLECSGGKINIYEKGGIWKMGKIWIGRGSDRISNSWGSRRQAEEEAQADTPQPPCPRPTPERDLCDIPPANFQPS